MELELFKKVHCRILDYNSELCLKSANWGYKVHQMLLENKLYLGQMDISGEQSTSFIYAVATAVIVGEFGKFLNKDYFSDETELSLDELSLNFNQIIGFVDKDIDKDRLELLKEGNTVGLQDIWEAIWGWKREIYKSLSSVYEQKGEKEPDVTIFKSLLDLMEESGVNQISSQRLSAYAYISNGFQY